VTKLDFNTVLAIGIHDMKNSLNRVLSALEDLSGSVDTDQHRDASVVGQLQYEARRMKDNLTKMLMLYRDGQGLYEPRFIDCPVYELLEDCWLNNKPLLDQRDLNCVLDCDEALTWTLDKYLVESLVENVLTDTIRYTHSRIHLSAWAEDGWLNLMVEDDGLGFPETMLGPRGLDQTAAPDAKLGHTGVGLYFCALVADRHGRSEAERGSIELSNGSSLGGGQFLLRLPALA
jgi:signal transduction histidine kinase